MSVYLNQLPQSVKFKNNDETLVIEFNSKDSNFYFNEQCFVDVSDIDFIIDSLRSIQSISKETNKN